MDVIPANQRKVLRDLAKRWMELAALPVMDQRKRLWRAVHDLRAERPVILFETGWIDGFVAAEEIVCEHPWLRTVERAMRTTIRQAKELGDDLVVEPHYRMGWRLDFSGYGVPIEMHHAVNGPETSVGYSFNFPIARPEDAEKLRPRTFAVNRSLTLELKCMLEDIVGDVLPVKLGNYDPFIYEFGEAPYGDTGFNGNFFFGLTWQVYRFIGNQGLLYWVYDSPDTIHRLMRYMLADRLTVFDYLEREGLLVPNADSQMAGPRSYGFVSDLPAADGRAGARLKDLWGWAESQEATNLSPAMYREFVLPYLAELSSRFGLIYYGCCERVDDRLEMILEAIPNLRSVSVSGWSTFKKTAELLGKRYVYSRKPVPAYISGPSPDWDALERDLRQTREAAAGCNLEVLFRDVYTVNGDRARLRRWVDLAKAVFEIG